MFIVTINQPGKMTGYLRGTIWTTERDRAQAFASRPNAEAALEKAKKFMARKTDVKFTAIEPA